MTVRKLSVALDPKVADAAAAAAERDGLSLSAWLNQAAENALAIQSGLTAVADYECEFGAFTEQEVADAERVLAELSARRASRLASPQIS
jgi:hypothetical protein